MYKGWLVGWCCWYFFKIGVYLIGCMEVWEVECVVKIVCGEIVSMVECKVGCKVVLIGLFVEGMCVGVVLYELCLEFEFKGEWCLVGWKVGKIMWEIVCEVLCSMCKGK